jgi:hypothetical protein
MKTVKMNGNLMIIMKRIWKWKNKIIMNKWKKILNKMKKNKKLILILKMNIMMNMVNIFDIVF